MSQASSAMNDAYNGYQDQAIPFGSEPLLSFDDASEESSPRPDSTATDAATEPKRRHPCLYCEKSFTTSGHLARHTRTHTGERKHVCPFPGCDTKCSRADNLQQHYRIHLAPGMRRSGARRTAGGTSKRSSKATVADAPSLPPPPVTPPPLVPARVYSVPQDQPPQSPPPLTQAAHTSSGFADRPQPRTEHESPILPRYSPHIEPPLSRMSPMPERSAYVPRRDSVPDSREDEVGYSGYEETPILSRRHHTQPQQQYLPSLNTELGGYDDHDYSPSSSRYSAASYPHSSPTIADYDRYPRDSSQASSSGSSHSSPSHSHLNSPQMPTTVSMAYPSSSANIGYGSHVGSKIAMSAHSTQPFEAALASYASHSPSASVASQQFAYQAPSRFPSPPQMTTHEDVYQRRPSYITTSYVHHPQPIAYHYDYDYTTNGIQQQWKSDVGVRHRNSIGTLVQ